MYRYTHIVLEGQLSEQKAEFLVEVSVENETGNRSDFESKTCLGSLRVLENVPYIEILVQLVSSLFCAGYQLTCLLSTFADFKNSHSVLMGRHLLILLCPNSQSVGGPAMGPVCTRKSFRRSHEGGCLLLVCVRWLVEWLVCPAVLGNWMW